MSIGAIEGSNRNILADNINFCPRTPESTYYEAVNINVDKIARNSESVNCSFPCDRRRSSLSVNLETPSSDTDIDPENFLLSEPPEDGCCDDIFPGELDLGEVSDTSTYFSSLDYQFPEQFELSNYKLLSQIGTGAFSRVFKAIDMTSIDPIPVAIKVLRKSNALSEGVFNNCKDIKSSSRKQVMNEIAIHEMVSKNSPYFFPRFIDCQESATYFYIVSEFIAGGEIFDRILQLSSFSEDLARHVITQVALAVKRMHYMGIVHRDIKPENLLFEPIPFHGHHGDIQKEDDFELGVGGGGIGLVKLMDFGLAKKISCNTAETPCGTIEYAAPEMFSSNQYSTKVDMWGIGCVLFTLLCGYPPFDGKTPSTLVNKITEGDYEFSAPWWDDVSSGAKNAITHLLEVDPSKRYDIDDFLNDPWLNSYDCLKHSNLKTYATVEGVLKGSCDTKMEPPYSALGYKVQERDDTESNSSESSEYICIAEDDRNLRGSWIGEPNVPFTLSLKRSSVYRRRENGMFFW